MTTRQQLLDNFKQSIPAGRSSSTLTRYPYMVGRFIDYIGVKDTYSKNDAIMFLNHLSQQGHRANYLRWTSFPLRAFYRSLGLPVPLSKGELPPLPKEHELVKPALTTKQVCELINIVKSRGTSRMKTYLALSTVYGLRAIELASVRNEDISNNTLMLKTVKGGVVSEQPIPIPEEVRQYLHSYNFKPLTTQTLNCLFRAMQKRARQKHKPGEGFQAIRRSLVRGLVASGANPEFINLFMRWSSASTSGIMGMYPHPDESEYEKAYRKIFKKHPFLKEWQ